MNQGDVLSAIGIAAATAVLTSLCWAFLRWIFPASEDPTVFLAGQEVYWTRLCFSRLILPGMLLWPVIGYGLHHILGIVVPAWQSRSTDYLHLMPAVWIFRLCGAMFLAIPLVLLVVLGFQVMFRSRAATAELLAAYCALGTEQHGVNTFRTEMASFVFIAGIGFLSAYMDLATVSFITPQGLLVRDVLGPDFHRPFGDVREIKLEGRGDDAAYRIRFVDGEEWKTTAHTMSGIPVFLEEAMETLSRESGVPIVEDPNRRTASPPPPPP